MKTIATGICSTDRIVRQNEDGPLSHGTQSARPRSLVAPYFNLVRQYDHVAHGGSGQAVDYAFVIMKCNEGKREEVESGSDVDLGAGAGASQVMAGISALRLLGERARLTHEVSFLLLLASSFSASTSTSPRNDIKGITSLSLKSRHRLLCPGAFWM